MGRRARRWTWRVQGKISPFSAIAMVLYGAGWTEPIPMNDAFRKRRWHVTAAVLAGPLVYLALTFGAVAGFKALLDSTVSTFLTRMVGQMLLTFAALCILSLIPLPPLDGARIVFTLAPRST